MKFVHILVCEYTGIKVANELKAQQLKKIKTKDSFELSQYNHD